MIVQTGNYVTTYRGLGDDSTDSSSNGFDTDFLSGSVVTAFVAGIAIIVILKTMEPGKKSSSGSSSGSSNKIWIDGAWRSPDYESRSNDYGVRPQRKKKAS